MLSGTAGGMTGDIWADSKRTLQSVARGIAQANPGRKWRPGEMLDAVNDAIKTMNGIAPMEKIAAQAQLAGAKAQTDYFNAETRRIDEERKAAADAERERKDKTAHEDRVTKMDADLKRASMTNDVRLKVAHLQAATRLQAADIAQAGANQRAEMVDEYRNRALDANIDEKEWQTQMTAALKEQGMDDAFINKVFSAQASAGQAVTPPQRPAKKALPAVPARRTPGGAKPSAAQGGYTSADDVVKAYKAGKLTHDKASEILRQSGWAE
jgi:hypothetical protein